MGAPAPEGAKTVVLTAENFHKEPTVAPVAPSGRDSELLELKGTVPPMAELSSSKVDTFDERELVRRLERLGGTVRSAGSAGMAGEREISARAVFPNGDDVRVALMTTLGQPMHGWTRDVYTSAVAVGTKQRLFVTVLREPPHREVGEALGIAGTEVMAPDLTAIADRLEGGGYTLVRCWKDDWEATCTGRKDARIVTLQVYGEQMGEPGVQFLAGLKNTDATHTVELTVYEPMESRPTLEAVLGVPGAAKGDPPSAWYAEMDE
ncbi:MAG: hypothetical protein R3F61_04320 [Myxococcota bacterium]